MTPRRPDNIQSLALSNNLNVAVTQPFNREEGPTRLEVGPEFTKKAFALTTQDPFAGPIMAQDGVYEIALYKSIPSEIPPLDQIRERVATDLKQAQALMQARMAGMTFYQAATNGLAQGKSFADICASAQVKPMELPPFSLSTRDMPAVEEYMELNQLKQAAFSTEPGKVSNLYPTREGGMVLYVKQKLPLDETKMKAELPEFTDMLRRRRQEEAFNLWMSREADRSLRDTPYYQMMLQQQQPPPSMRGAPAAKAKS
jgi:hypothetical protein